MEVVAKNLRRARSLAKSFSSLETNECSHGEYEIKGEPTRMRFVSTMSFWGSRRDVRRVSPSMDVVQMRCGCVG